jgi:hypothetical protein
LGNAFENALMNMGKASRVLLIYAVAVGGYFLSLPLTVARWGVQGFMWSYVLLCLMVAAGSAKVYFSSRQRKTMNAQYETSSP